MCSKERKISPNDYLFISISKNGNKLVDIYQNNFESVAGIIKTVSRNISNCTGMTMLCVRNQSQGWSFDMPLVFSA